MRWYLGGVRIIPLISVVVIVGLLAGALRGAAAPVPSLTQGVLSPVPVVAVIALIPPLLILSAWLELPLASMAVSVRPAAVGPCVMAVVCVMFAVASGPTGHVGAVVENARNSLGLLGLALLGTRWLGRRGGVLVPVAYLLASFLLGRSSGSYISRPWAWVLRDGGDMLALVLAAMCAVAGLVAALTIPRAMVLRGEA